MQVSAAGKDDAFLAVDPAFLRRRRGLGLARGQFGGRRGLLARGARRRRSSERIVSFTRPPRSIRRQNYDLAPAAAIPNYRGLTRARSVATLGRARAGLKEEDTKISAGTDTVTNIGADGGPQRASLAAAAVGAALIAAAIYASLSAPRVGLRRPRRRGGAGAVAARLSRYVLPTAPLLIDAAAFALFAYQRNDSLAFWQLAGSWGDAMRLDIADASVAYCVYLGGSLSALLGSCAPAASDRGARPRRPAVPVQARRRARRRLAYGRNRRPGSRRSRRFRRKCSSAASSCCSS